MKAALKCVALAALLAALASFASARADAVVRPTVFNDLNSPVSQQQQQQQAQQQSLQSQAAVASNSTASTHAVVAAAAAAVAGNDNTKSAQQLQLQQQQQQQLQLQQQQQQHANSNANINFDSISPIKINPLRSRFCSSNLRPLGLQFAHIVDDLSLSASSFSNEQVGPQMARLNSDAGGGAWCPAKPIGLSSSLTGGEWIQVKLNKSFVINAIETQGRALGKEFVPFFELEYSRNSGNTWHKWKDYHGHSLLKANQDSASIARNELNPPIVGANVVRVVPSSQHLRTVCLRFELYGCVYDDGAPIAYATADGVIENRWGHLVDYTYDGARVHSQADNRYLLAGGLGQLIDGVRGADNFRHNAGFEWLGWKAMNGDVIVEFAFKTLRNFSDAALYSNNFFSAGVEVFQAVDVHYGIDVSLSGEYLRDSIVEQRLRRLKQQATATTTNNVDAAAVDALLATSQQQHHKQQQTTLWSTDVTSIEYEPDKRSEVARPVKVHLKQRLANRLRFVLKFASKWILVSEVEFSSTAVDVLSLDAALSSTSSQLATLQLLDTLKAAKSYEQYFAIVREFQLRRIAANAFLEPQTSKDLINVKANEANSNNNNDLQATQSVSMQATNEQVLADDAPSQQAAPQPQQAHSATVSGPSPARGTPFWPTQGSGAADFSPLANPIFNSQPPMQVSGGDPSTPQFPFWQTANNNFQNSDNNQQQPQLPPSQQQQPSSSSSSLATLIVALVLLSLVGFAFVIGGARLKQARKAAHLPRHLAAGKSFIATSQAPFMTILSNNNNNQATLRRSSNASPNSSGGHATGSNPSEYGNMFSYGAFASNNQHPTLRNNNNNNNNSTPTQKGATQSQLLVSLRDSNGAQASKPQTVNTQLIVGLNAINPLNQAAVQQHQHQQQQQQQYGQFGTCSTQQYATRDYAVPELQAQHHHHQPLAFTTNKTLIVPTNNGGFRTIVGQPTISRQQQQQHLNQNHCQRLVNEADMHNYEHIYHDADSLIHANHFQRANTIANRQQQQQQQHHNELSPNGSTSNSTSISSTSRLVSNTTNNALAVNADKKHCYVGADLS